MKVALWCRIVVMLMCLFFIPTVVTAHAETAQLAKKFTKYEQFIMIDKSTNKLFFYEKGELIKSFPVATGKKPSYTPEGLVTVNEKIKGGDPKNPLGDRWLGLKVTLNGRTTYAYGIHGNNNEKSIGKYVSAGCIRMHNKDVRWLFDQIKKSTPVYITA
jgi:lipoprotein-anchoring transpeptidase ErfK/SrfK